MKSHPPSHLASRRSRRLLVLLAGVLVVSLAAIGLLDLPRSLTILAVIGYWAVAARLDATVGRPMRDRAKLDERQKVALDRAHRVAYQVMSLCLLAALVPGLLLDGVVWPEFATRTLPLVLLGSLAILHLLLPQLILAWNEPDPVREEETAEVLADVR